MIGMVTSILLAAIIAATCLGDGWMGHACDNINDIADCNDNLTMNYFYAGSNASRLCDAAVTFIRCVDAYPLSCRKNQHFFSGIRHLNTKVTIDDCPALLEEEVPVNTTETVTTVSPCTCSATTTRWSYASLILLVVLLTMS
ncbi:uncharacterized protein LOC124137198 [Haliotis rufescens]|uniref:uncharacterized protein LOC124137198 n=1 Tax=Haliotis rufescens TaxID=6454 RepID=UPI00201EF1DE|nr:uncharacterized protein LOC124137198 [Haliotis rufescens]